MSVFEALQNAWDVVDNTREAADASSPFVERIGNGMSAGGGALAAIGSVLGVPALSVAGPFIAAGGMGMEIGSFADERLGLSNKASDAMTGDSDERTYDQGLTPAHFRGPAGQAESQLLNTGRQQSFLKDETARQVEIAKLAKMHGATGAWNSMPKNMLKAYDIDVDEKKRDKEMMGLFGHLTQ